MFFFYNSTNIATIFKNLYLHDTNQIINWWLARQIMWGLIVVEGGSLWKKWFCKMETLFWKTLNQSRKNEGAFFLTRERTEDYVQFINPIHGKAKCFFLILSIYKNWKICLMNERKWNISFIPLKNSWKQIIKQNWRNSVIDN